MNRMEPQRERTRGWTRYLGLGTTGTALAVSALMLMMPVASATSAGLTILPPYRHLSASVSLSVSHGACAKATFQKVPTWSLKKGAFRSSMTANAPSCRTQPTANAAYASGSLSLSTPIKFLTSGNHSITVRWSVTENESNSITPWTTCSLNYAAAYSGCITYSEVTFFAYAMLWDNSNSSWGQYGYGYTFGNFLDLYNFSTVQNYSQNYCYLSTCYHYGGNFSLGNLTNAFSGSVLASNLLNLSGTSVINKNDNFTLDIYTFFQADAAAYVQSASATGHASAKAAVNAATLGNGILLKGIAIV